MDKEYIERETLLSAIQDADADVMADYGPENGTEWGFSREVVVKVIQSVQTTDAVAPVVRCRECIKSGVTEFGKRYCKEPLGMYGCVPVEDDNFCSHGKRKEDAK